MNRVHVAKTYGHAHAFLRDIVMSIPFGSIPVYFGGGGLSDMQFPHIVGMAAYSTKARWTFFKHFVTNFWG